MKYRIYTGEEMKHEGKAFLDTGSPFAVSNDETFVVTRHKRFFVSGKQLSSIYKHSFDYVPLKSFRDKFVFLYKNRKELKEELLKHAKKLNHDKLKFVCNSETLGVYLIGKSPRTVLFMGFQTGCVSLCYWNKRDISLSVRQKKVFQDFLASIADLIDLGKRYDTDNISSKMVVPFFKQSSGVSLEKIAYEYKVYRND